MSPGIRAGNSIHKEQNLGEENGKIKKTQGHSNCRISL